jgi:hypothetical protein
MELKDYIEFGSRTTMIQLNSVNTASLALSIVGAAFAAFCLWLTVRIVNRRERWAKWALAAVVGPAVLYTASFGPACWLQSPKIFARWKMCQAPQIYWPIGCVVEHAPEPVKNAIAWYATALGGVYIVYIPDCQTLLLNPR